MKSSDIASAFIPPVAALSLGQINSIVGICGGLLGIAYLLWKWRKESQEG